MTGIAEITATDPRLAAEIRRGKQLVSAAARRDIRAGATRRANPHCRCCYAWVGNVGECFGFEGVAEPRCWRKRRRP